MNDKHPDEAVMTTAADQGRRGLLAALARAGGLLLLIAGGGWLVRSRSAASGEGASVGNPCAKCGSLFSCLLPQAERSRRQGIGLTGPVRRAIDGAKIDAGDIGCEDGRQAAERGS